MRVLLIMQLEDSDEIQRRVLGIKAKFEAFYQYLVYRFKGLEHNLYSISGKSFIQNGKHIELLPKNAQLHD